mgnify:CR=1 FL=1
MIEIGERLQELKEKKVECEKLREMLDWMKAEVGRSVREEGEERRGGIRED